MFYRILGINLHKISGWWLLRCSVWVHTAKRVHYWWTRNETRQRRWVWRSSQPDRIFLPARTKPFAGLGEPQLWPVAPDRTGFNWLRSNVPLLNQVKRHQDTFDSIRSNGWLFLTLTTLRPFYLESIPTDWTCKPLSDVSGFRLFDTRPVRSLKVSRSLFISIGHMSFASTVTDKQIGQPINSLQSQLF